MKSLGSTVSQPVEFERLGVIWNAFQWHCFDDRPLGKPW